MKWLVGACHLLRQSKRIVYVPTCFSRGHASNAKETPDIKGPIPYCRLAQLCPESRASARVWCEQQGQRIVHAALIVRRKFLRDFVCMLPRQARLNGNWQVARSITKSYNRCKSRSAVGVKRRRNVISVIWSWPQRQSFVCRSFGFE